MTLPALNLGLAQQDFKKLFSFPMLSRRKTLHQRSTRFKFSSREIISILFGNQLVFTFVLTLPSVGQNAQLLLKKNKITRTQRLGLHYQRRPASFCKSPFSHHTLDSRCLDNLPFGRLSEADSRTRRSKITSNVSIASSSPTSSWGTYSRGGGAGKASRGPTGTRPCGGPGATRSTLLPCCDSAAVESASSSSISL